jgi:hypothetical protein
VPLTLSVPWSFETRLTSFSHILVRESYASKSNLSNDFSNSSRSGFDTEHFNVRDAAFRDKRAACTFKFSFSLSIFSI